MQKDLSGAVSCNTETQRKVKIELSFLGVRVPYAESGKLTYIFP